MLKIFIRKIKKLTFKSPIYNFGQKKDYRNCYLIDKQYFYYKYKLNFVI
jgi:hypothetical protein